MGLETTLGRLAIALGLGLLVGLQRERAESTIAGLRTFALVTVMGGLSGLLAREFGGWVLGAALLAVAAMVVIGNVAKIRARVHDPGITTEVAVLLMFGVGAYLMYGAVEVGIVLGGAVAVLLHAKARLHGLVARLGDQDVAAIMRFVLLTLVILPVLPNQTFGPFDVLNPRHMWLMVVLIVGISLGGYLAYKLLGDRVGTLLAGILGGTISSTATTVTYGRMGRLGKDTASLSAVVILLASTVVFVRVLVEIAVVAPASLRVSAPPLIALLLAFGGLSHLAWSRREADAGAMPEQGNPTEMRFALAFGLLYGVILLAVAAGKEWFGDEGLYVVAVISGLTDMDAITLSTATLTRQGRVAPETLWRVVVVASIANLAFKLGVAGALGGRGLMARLAPYYGAGALFGILVILFWPDGLFG
jgi:uncharacterized membrane protein (DUF4010 family)